MTRILISVLAVASLVASLGGCKEEEAPESDEIRALMARYVGAANNRDGETAAASITAGSIAQYGKLIELGLNGKRKDVEALDAMDLYEVLLMRVCARRRDIEGLDARAYVVYSTSQGWYVDDESLTIEIESIKVYGDNAYAKAYFSDGFDKSLVGIPLTFKREDGFWKIDENSWRGVFKQVAAERAQLDGVSLAQAVLSLVEEDTGKTAPITVWSPMR